MSMPSRFVWVLVFCLILIASSNAFSQTIAYRVVPLGPVIDSPNSPINPIPTGINKQGWVVGYNRRPFGGQPSGFLWKGGTVYAMPTLGGTCSTASAINDQGVAVGTVCLPGDTTRHAAQWKGGTSLVDIDISGGVFSTANFINNKGHVMGLYTQSDGSSHMYYRTFATFKDVGANLFPGGLNDAGEIAGQFDVGPPDPVSGVAPTHGFYWYKGVLTDFGALFGTNYNYAVDIDNAGRIAATTDLAGDVTAHGIIWDHGFVADLSPLPPYNQVSWALGMNNKVQLVGLSGLKDPFPEDGPPINSMMCPCTPVLWTNGTVLDLNALVPPEWVVVFAFDINDGGQIIAQARKNGGGRQAVKLVPLVSATAMARTLSARSVRPKAGVNGPSRLVREKTGAIREVR